MLYIFKDFRIVCCDTQDNGPQCGTVSKVMVWVIAIRKGLSKIQEHSKITRNLQSLVQTSEKSLALPFAISTGACKGVQQVLAYFLIAGTYLITMSLLIFSSCMSMMSKRQTSSSLLDRSVVMCSTFDFLLHLCEVALSVLHVYFETPLA